MEVKAEGLESALLPIVGIGRDLISRFHFTCDYTDTLPKCGRSTMINRTVVLEDLKERTLEEVLWEVVRQQEVLTVHLAECEAVTIKPWPRLKPLPVLEGFVPEGWKDAIYEFD